MAMARNRDPLDAGLWRAMPDVRKSAGLADKGVVSEQGCAVTGHKTESNYAHYRHFETETLRKATNKMPSIPE